MIWVARKKKRNNQDLFFSFLLLAPGWKGKQSCSLCSQVHVTCPVMLISDHSLTSWPVRTHTQSKQSCVLLLLHLGDAVINGTTVVFPAAKLKSQASAESPRVIILTTPSLKCPSKDWGRTMGGTGCSSYSESFFWNVFPFPKIVLTEISFIWLLPGNLSLKYT